MTNNADSILDVVINHYADNRVRYQDVCSMQIPEDADERIYILQDMIRSALIARIKSAGCVDVPITDGKVRLDYGQEIDMDHYPIAGDLRRIVPALAKRESLTGLIGLIKQTGAERWIVYPAELINVCDPEYVRSSVATRALIRAADTESRMSTGDDQCLGYLLDQATEILVRIWIKDHNVSPQQYAKWRSQGKQAVRRTLSDNVQAGVYHSC